jgi:hypothetical protein
VSAIVGAVEVTKEQLHDMQHALGLDDYGQGTWYRNHFVAGPECDGWEGLCALVELGLMKRHEPRPLFGGDYCFVVTEEGKRYVRENSPQPPKLSRSAARYRRWLRSGADMSFGDWLKEASRV